MKILENILSGISVMQSSGETDIKIRAIHFDSRNVTEDSLFVAIRGTSVDGHTFISQAAKNGASAIVCEEVPENLPGKTTVIKVADTRKALALLAGNFYENPSRKLKLVGVTGTNGKTTIVNLLYELFKRNGYKAGLLSTIGNYIDETLLTTQLTTPDSVTINRLLAEMVENGCEYAFMEVSSHAVAQGRIEGIYFSGGVFTNISHDHLDYHNTFDAYIRAKKGFFDVLPSESFALVNADDKNSAVMLQNTKASHRTYGLKTPADFTATLLEVYKEGMILEVNRKEVATRLLGRFNVYNLLAVYATAVLLGEETDKMLAAISQLKPVKGRFETIQSPHGVIAIVDYAHSPNALENVLKAIDRMRTGKETLISLVGAGGDRDRTKRPRMAGVVADYADKIILTSDNPRNENPESIIEEMKNGLDETSESRTITITDRREAIRTACMMAGEGDIILVPGKGHENYQEIQGERYHFDDTEIIKEQFGITETKSD